MRPFHVLWAVNVFKVTFVWSLKRKHESDRIFLLPNIFNLCNGSFDFYILATLFLEVDQDVRAQKCQCVSMDVLIGRGSTERVA